MIRVTTVPLGHLAGKPRASGDDPDSHHSGLNTGP